MKKSILLYASVSFLSCFCMNNHHQKIRLIKDNSKNYDSEYFDNKTITLVHNFKNMETETIETYKLKKFDTRYYFIKFSKDDQSNYYGTYYKKQHDKDIKLIHRYDQQEAQENFNRCHNSCISNFTNNIND